jgi:membrane-bound serine protease (ClpP class)
MTGWIVALALLGVALICIEIFIPGMVVGICGALSLIGAVALCYIHYGPGPGNLSLIALLVFGVIFVCWWLSWLPTSSVGRWWTLHTAVGGPEQHPQMSPLQGAAGKAVTDLRPSGIALLDGRRIDVVAESGWIAAGEAVQVLRTKV